METLLVRLKPYDPRRGHVLRRFTYRGLKFHEERGWYVVEKPIAEYLRNVLQREGDPHAPRAFDVATEEDAKALDAHEEHEAKTRKNAAEAPRLATGRGDLATHDLRTPAPRVTTPAKPAAARAEVDKSKKDQA